MKKDALTLFIVAIAVVAQSQKRIAYTQEQLDQIQGGQMADFNLEKYIDATFFQESTVAFSQISLSEEQV